MKRTLVLTLLALLGITAAHAQQQFATLQHGDNISAYYGTSALANAHEAATNGDIITLSPGSFTSVDITKAITIRGAGMTLDTVAGTNPTSLLGDFEISVGNDTSYLFHMEGINCAGKVKYYEIYYPEFVKCYFHDFTEPNDYTAQTATMQNAFFINCIIDNYSGYRTIGTNFVNCAILKISDYGGNPQFQNCIARINSGNNIIISVSISNSIVYYLYGANTGSGWSYNTYSSFNSIGINTGGDNDVYYYGITAEQNLHNYFGLESVFKTFRGNHEDGMNFELQDSIANNILGNDGTQVGIYGGQFPFNPRVLNYSATVASQSRPDGKLEVTIQPIND